MTITRSLVWAGITAALVALACAALGWPHFGI